jgi:hypothetical protein
MRVRSRRIGGIRCLPIENDPILGQHQASTAPGRPHGSTRKRERGNRTHRESGVNSAPGKGTLPLLSAAILPLLSARGRGSRPSTWQLRWEGKPEKATCSSRDFRPIAQQGPIAQPRTCTYWQPQHYLGPAERSSGRGQCRVRRLGNPNSFQMLDSTP